MLQNQFLSQRRIDFQKELLVRIYIYRRRKRRSREMQKKKGKEIGTWEGAVVDRHQRRLHKTYEGVEVGSYDPQLLIHASCLVQFRTEFRKLLLHRHTNKSSPRKNTLLSRSLSLARAQRQCFLLTPEGIFSIPIIPTRYPSMPLRTYYPSVVNNAVVPWPL